jgi:hypothetical protein
MKLTINQVVTRLSAEFRERYPDYQNLEPVESQRLLAALRDELFPARMLVEIDSSERMTKVIEEEIRKLLFGK